MRAKGDVALDERCLDGWKLSSTKALLSEKTVHRASPYCTQKHSPCIHPSTFDVGRSSTYEHRTRRAQRNQLVGIDRQIIGRQWAGIFEKVARHPVVLIRGCDILNLFAKLPAENLG